MTLSQRVTRSRQTEDEEKDASPDGPWVEVASPVDSSTTTLVSLGAEKKVKIINYHQYTQKTQTVYIPL